jgi:23S rRNA (pseudouridine1915-N3)-methyltransferase
MKIIAVGKKPPRWLDEPLDDYSRRLRAVWRPEWVLIHHSPQNSPETAKNVESEQILARIKPDDYVILLDETGQLLSSPELAAKLKTQTGRSVVCIIGGAYGVNQAVKQRANLIWSLSKLVFPHQIVRLILIEQLYRAQCIINHHPYHHQ